MPATRKPICQPFGNGIALPYRDSFTTNEFERIKDGHVPARMEDKWFIFYEAPYLYFHRSWTGFAAFRLRIESDESGSVVTEALGEKDMASKQGVDYNARLIDFLISNTLLGKDKPFPVPGDLPNTPDGLWQHHIAGTRHAEVVISRKPWWRFW